MPKFEGAKRTKGGGWTGELTFYTGSEYQQFPHKSLTQKMSKCEGIDHFEKIKKMWLYKTPLSEWQLTQLVWNHQFVVIQSLDWYWSIEKNNEVILLQRNEKFTEVKDFEEGNSRKAPVVEIKHGVGKGTMKGLIEFLYSEKELKTEYHLVFSNCKTLANRVFNKFVVEGTVEEPSIFS